MFESQNTQYKIISISVPGSRLFSSLTKRLIKLLLINISTNEFIISFISLINSFYLVKKLFYGCIPLILIHIVNHRLV